MEEALVGCGGQRGLEAWVHGLSSSDSSTSPYVFLEISFKKNVTFTHQIVTRCSIFIKTLEDWSSLHPQRAKCSEGGQREMTLGSGIHWSFLEPRGPPGDS